MNQFVVVFTTEGGDLYHEHFVDYDDARDFIDANGDKALLTYMDENDGLVVEDYT